MEWWQLLLILCLSCPIQLLVHVVVDGFTLSNSAALDRSTSHSLMTAHALQRSRSASLTSCRLAATSSIDDGDLQLLLQDLLLASSLSYLSMDEKGRKPMTASPYYEKAVARKLQPIRQVMDEQSQSGATIFRQNNGRIIVACRGSANWKNFQTNLDFKLVQVEDALLVDDEKASPDEDMLVHKGFQQASLGLWRVLQPELENIWNDDSTQAEPILTFTGHSLGAATALLCAVQHSGLQRCSRHGNRTTAASVITFGGPRLCNTPLAEYWMTHCFSSGVKAASRSNEVIVANLVHSKDPILQQNQAVWDALGFAIVGQEVLCESERPMVYDWSGDDLRSASLTGTSKLDKTALAFNFWDHCVYLGTFVGPRLI